LRYKFAPPDIGHPSFPPGHSGYWFMSGMRTFPMLSHTYDVYTMTRQQDFLSGPHAGERWNLEPRMFIYKDNVLEQDIELPHEPFVSFGEPLGEHPIFVLSDFSPKYDVGYFVLQNLVDPYVDSQSQGGEQVYKVTSDGVTQVATMPTITDEPFLQNVRSLLFKPETNTLFLSRFSPFGEDPYEYISFNGMQTHTRKQKPATEFIGSIIQRKTDMLVSSTFAANHSRSLLLGSDEFDLGLYIDPMQGQIGDQWESTRAWRRQARGLTETTELHNRRLY